MFQGVLGTATLLAGAQLALALRAVSTLGSLPRLGACAVGPEVPVTIVIPARDEEEALPDLLESLVDQGVSLGRIIVVDDGSTDRTASMVLLYGVRLVRAGDLPDGWKGKSHACSRGAELAATDWILFLDADVRLKPGAIASAFAAVDRAGVSALTLFPEQILGGLAEKLILPLAFQQMFMGFRPRGKTANGQFILVRRSAYESIGGHGAVRTSIVEDVDLGERLAATGEVLLYRGEHLAGVRMYRDFGHIAEGFGKNAAVFLTRDPVGGALTVLGSIAGVAPICWLIAGIFAGRRKDIIAGLIGIAAGIAGYLPWVRMNGMNPVWALAHPVGAGLFQLISLRSVAAGLGVIPTTWKGRRY